jgi:hypothetical protein
MSSSSSLKEYKVSHDVELLASAVFNLCSFQSVPYRTDLSDRTITAEPGKFGIIFEDLPIPYTLLHDRREVNRLTVCYYCTVSYRCDGVVSCRRAVNSAFYHILSEVKRKLAKNR